MSRPRKTIFFFAILFLFIPASGLAEIGKWMPSIVDYEADIDIYGISRIYDTKTDDWSMKQKSLWMKENVTLSFNGFVYHPRLIEYKLGLTVGLLQDRYESDASSASYSRSRSGWSNGLNLRAKILPMHPYNLELFYLRYEPLSGSGFSSVSTVSYGKGAIFKYERKPYFFNASYINNTRESDIDTSEWTSYMANFTYFKQYLEYRSLSLSGSFRRIEFSSDTSSDKSIGNSASLSNSISLRKLNVSTSLRYYTSEYGSSSTNTFSWAESLGFSLPLNFRGTINYAYTKSESENLFHEGSDTTSKSNSGYFSLTHQLYRSLVTSYGVGYTRIDSSEGSVESFSNKFHVNYVKNIPGGILRSGIGFGRTNTKRDGVTTTIDTAFRQRVPRDISEPLFLLTDENVAADSITVFLLDPDVPEHRIQLEEGTHYMITPFGVAFEIEIILLPPEFPEPAVYDFLVSYKSTEEDAEYQTDTFNFRLSSDLFERFYPYYRHYSTKREVMSGSTQWGDYDQVSDTAGIQVVLMPFRFLAEYTHVESDIVPSSTWALGAYYQKDLTRTLRLNARVQYTKNSYPEGTSGNGISYSEQITGAAFGIIKRFPVKGVSLSASGSYWRRTALSDANSYSLSSSVAWKVGRFHFELGAAINFTESESAIVNTERTYQNYYFRLRRKLF